MTTAQKNDGTGASVSRSLEPLKRHDLKELFALTGMDALNRILDLDDPERMVRSMAPVDFFWLIKKIGEEDALPLLKMASTEQWQYLMDVDIWQKDRITPDQTAVWLERLHRADPEKLVKWLFSEGQSLAYYFLLKNIKVEIRREDEIYELPPDFFTLDKLFYIRILDKDHEAFIGDMLRQMAHENYDRYQALLLGLAGVLPAELEEDMYRMRNVRLAEDGFLLFEEAQGVYAYLKAESLLKGPSLPAPYLKDDKEVAGLVPMSHLFHAQQDMLLTESTAQIHDRLFLDRIRVEFAGLCNQIISADTLRVNDLEVLIKVCRKASGYISLGLERLSGGNRAVCEQILKDHPLISLFRVGFGLALELRWEAERWIEKAWFRRFDFSPQFWGEDWGGTLSGVLQSKPLYYDRTREGNDNKEFEQLSEIEDARTIVRRLMALDRLLEGLSRRHPLDKGRLKSPFFTFRPLLFTFWARRQLDLSPGFDALSIEETKGFFRLLQKDDKGPPYRLPGYREVFIGTFMNASGFGADENRLLRETLDILWGGFVEEYAWVTEDELDRRFIRYILIKAVPGT